MRIVTFDRIEITHAHATAGPAADHHAEPPEEGILTGLAAAPLGQSILEAARRAAELHQRHHRSTTREATP